MENAIKVNNDMQLKEVFDILEKNNVKSIDNLGLWYDWFCKTSSLHNRGITLLRKLKSIKNTTKFNKETTYVWFKNNCPCRGGLYDDFRIADKETGDVLYTIVPKNVEYEETEVWGRENNFDKPLVKGTWKDVKDFFLA